MLLLTRQRVREAPPNERLDLIVIKAQERSPGQPASASLEDQAYRQLRNALVEGVFSPGQKLSIRRIAAEIGTSPMPVRTALRRLAAEQALEVLPSGTAIVPHLTRAGFQELGSIRAVLEPLAVELAAVALSKRTRKELDDTLRQERKARQDGDPERFLQFDRKFLFTLYRAAAAPMLFAMIEATWLRRGPHFWLARWILITRAPGAARHADMLAAIDRGNVAEASNLLRTEIQSTTFYLLERMQFADDPRPQTPLQPLNLRAEGVGNPTSRIVASKDHRQVG